MVRDVWDVSREEGGWILLCNRSFNDRVLMEVKNFQHAIQPFNVNNCRGDKLLLRGSNFGSYLVKLMYEMLNCSISSPFPFLFLSIWNPMVPLNVGFFV